MEETVNLKPGHQPRHLVWGFLPFQKQAVLHHLEGLTQPSRADAIGIHHDEGVDQSPVVTIVCITDERVCISVRRPELCPLIQHGGDVLGVLIVGGRIPAPE